MSAFLLLPVFMFGSFCLLMGLMLLLRLRSVEAALLRLRPEAAAQRHPTDTNAQRDARRPLNVLFLHPDLGIGGAERLVVDAAVALQRHQRRTPVRVTVVTNHHDPRRAFAETVDGTVRVVVSGAWLPATVFGRGKVFCAALRMAWAAVTSCLFYRDTDCFFVDQVAAVLPVLRLLAPSTPSLFYCHFPDQCCDANRDAEGNFVKSPSLLHQLYRRCFDSLEARAMSCADSIVSNSKYSREMTVKTFPHLQSVIDPEADIFYPPVSWANRGVASPDTEPSLAEEGLEALRKRIQGRSVVLSINRYERKKNLPLAIEAFVRVMSAVSDNTSKRPFLVMAGGYDERLPENVEHLQELKNLAARHHLTDDHVMFLQNISDTIKDQLLSECCCLIYTPDMEHFGIVPTEGMACSKPVVAVNRGGPCESVGEGGTLCDPTPEAMATAVAAYVEDEALAKRVGAAGRQRALELFSMDAFGEKLAARMVDLWIGKNLQLDDSKEKSDDKKKS